ncbi:MAG: hypothetical protein KFB96_10405 [Thiocapsa sp.]|uniref:hypothetical protein n=1 Tax=Thiocapsa sp. TaxID=2024551 RepID=UPI001BCB1623|nr:hypothetical protein [Thiocapsa sp.]QVL50770.1 MAG: hypothetical protein KFB96_10405 [Thiocapsa sp.]
MDARLITMIVAASTVLSGCPSPPWGTRADAKYEADQAAAVAYYKERGEQRAREHDIKAAIAREEEEARKAKAEEARIASQMLIDRSGCTTGYVAGLACSTAQELQHLESLEVREQIAALRAQPLMAETTAYGQSWTLGCVFFGKEQAATIMAANAEDETFLIMTPLSFERSGTQMTLLHVATDSFFCP